MIYSYCYQKRFKYRFALKQFEMRVQFLFLILILLANNLNAQSGIEVLQKPDPKKKILIVEAACGECRFKMKGDGCDLAIRIKGKTYFVDGTDIDSHGDAHAKDGFCNAIRKTEIQGEIVNNRFVATYFKLLKDSEQKKEDQN